MRHSSIMVALLAGIFIADTALAAPRAVFVLDRSGSMSAALAGLRPATGNSRCKDAWLTMQLDMNAFFASHPTGYAALIGFGTDYGGVVNVTQTMYGTTYVAQAQANAALASLDPDLTGDCGLIDPRYNVTQLADAMCYGVQLLPYGESPTDRQLFVSSDGGENFSSGPCSGPANPSVTPPFDDKMYWQGRVLNALKADIPKPILTIRYWVGPFPMAAADAGPSSSSDDVEGGIASTKPGLVTEAVQGGVAQAAAYNDLAFFEYLVGDVGGILVVHADDDPILPVRVPAVSTWGILTLSLTLLVGARVYFRRRFAPQN